MYEVEVKVRADHEPVREALESTGATPQSTVEQVDTYFDAPHRDFAATDEALRLRRETGPSGEETAFLTYKGPRVEAESKTREEHETAVADASETTAVFEGLGFEPAATVEKLRERWTMDDYLVVLDEVRDLGQFVEVETEAEQIEPAREGAYEVLERLGLDPEAGVTTSYLGLLLDEGDARKE